MSLAHVKSRTTNRQALRNAAAGLHSRWKCCDKALVRTRTMFCLAPVVGLFMVEILNEKNPFTNLNFTELVMNLIWYAIVLFFLWLLFGRRRRAAVVYTSVLFVIGLINHFVVEYRGRILLPQDVLCWRTAANVSTEYSFAPDVFVAGAAALGALYLLSVKFWMVPQYQREYFQLKRVSAGLAGLSVAYIVAFFFTPWLPAVGIQAEQWRTQSNGFLLNFSLATRYSRVEKPEGYSLDSVGALTQNLLGQEGDDAVTLYDAPYIESQYEADTKNDSQTPQTVLTVTPDEKGTQPVNLICIMDESFGDMAIFDTLEVDGDTLPFYHSLKENTVKGWMYSPVTGAGTANVEYEFLTGNSVSFLPNETMAYELYVKEDMPSLISWAKSLGFQTTTMHPYFSSGWNRPVVYNHFGVDTQLYDTDFSMPEYTRGYISDKSDFEKIQSVTTAAAGEKTFIFNVTMQNHGGYNQGWNNLDRTIRLSGSMTGSSEYTEQYLNLMRETDRQLESLLSYYSQVEEPTMIVLFGDHQGKLSTWFYENKLYGKSLDDRTLEELQQAFVTPFFIWTNYDSQEAQDVMISSNYLGALTAKLSNYPTTGYMDFLMDLYAQLPVVNTQGFIDRDGQLTDDEELLTEQQRELLQQYDDLCYYNLFTKEREETVDNGFFLLNSQN